MKYIDPTGHGQCQTYEDCKDMGTTPMGTGSSDVGSNNKPRPKDDDEVNCNNDPDCVNADGDQIVESNTCNTSDNGLECAWKRITSWPDYAALNITVPIFWGLAGPHITIARDYHNNWYASGGGSLTFYGRGGSLGAGWLLRNNRTEEALENFMLGHTFTVSGGAGLGIAVVNGDPSYTHPEWNYQTELEDLALEVNATTPGIDASYTYGIFIYDNGNPDPWFPDIPRFWK